jgi:penicillin-binding protein 1A
MVLDKMLELEKITQLEYDEAMADDPYIRISQSAQVLARQEDSPYSYFIDQIIESVTEDLAKKFLWSTIEASNVLYNGGLRIVSTQNFAMQEIMDESFANDDFFPAGDFKVDVQYYISTRNRLTEKVTHHPVRRGTVKNMEQVDGLVDSMRDTILGANDDVVAERVIPVPQPQAAMIVMDYRTGEVKAMSGGRGDKQVSRGLNRATSSWRQPGSVFKVVASFAPGHAYLSDRRRSVCNRKQPSV